MILPGHWILEYSFAAYGARTEIMTDTDMEFGDYPSAEVFYCGYGTRHLPGPEAYDVVYRLARKAREAGITYLYKKQIPV